MIELTCKCGYGDEIEKFMKSKSGIDLPPGNYQCPRCGVAWTIKCLDSPKVLGVSQKDSNRNEPAILIDEGYLLYETE
jgi:hypothetical protein